MGSGPVTYRHADTMDKWDEEKLRKVVLSKSGNPRTTTDVSSDGCDDSRTSG